MEFNFKELEEAYQQAMVGAVRPSGIICNSLDRDCFITETSPPCDDCPLREKYAHP